MEIELNNSNDLFYSKVLSNETIRIIWWYDNKGCALIIPCSASFPRQALRP